MIRYVEAHGMARLLTEDILDLEGLGAWCGKGYERRVARIAVNYLREYHGIRRPSADEAFREIEKGLA